MCKITTYAIGLSWCWVFASPGHANPYYAKATASGSGNCSSWADACTLGPAISQAGIGDDVWAQAGTYYGPLTLKNGVRIIGGFAGTETSASQSDPAANATVIDGGGARAVVSTGNDSATVLRGFRIVGGDETEMDDGGGGMLISGGSVRIVECVFENNLATWCGAAVAIRGGSPQFVNCTFRNNGWVDPQDNTNVTPLTGAAVYLHSGSVTFTNCLFHDNKGGVGGVLSNEAGTAKFYHCTMVDNSATIGSGGAIHDEPGDVEVYNSILWDNTAVRGNAHIYHGRDGVTKVRYSDLQGGRPGTGNIDADPKFTDSAANDYTLLSTSPCRNAGLDSYLPLDVGDLDWDGITSETIPQDLDGCKRKRETSVDMGVYEYQDSGCCEDGDCAPGQFCCDYECEECCDDGACSSPEPYCKVSNHTCVECLNDGQCAPGELCCNNVCESWECCDVSDCNLGEVCCSNECVECCDDSDCTFPPLCRTSDHTCVLCLTDQNCPFGCCKPNGACGSCGGGGGGGTNQSSGPPP